jgi:hypothetical protein
VRGVLKTGGVSEEVVSVGGYGDAGTPVIVGTDILFVGAIFSGDASLLIGPLAGGAGKAIATVGSVRTPDIAVSGTNAFWAPGGVYEVPLDGSAAGTLVAEACGGPFVLDGTTFFCFGSDDEVLSVESGSATPLEIAPAADGRSRLAIAIDDANVYWLEAETAGGFQGVVAHLSSAPRAGGAAKELWSGPASSILYSHGVSLVLDGGDLYFSAGGLMRYSLAGGNAVELTSKGMISPAIAVDATHVYFGQQYYPDPSSQPTVRIARVAK